MAELPTTGRVQATGILVALLLCLSLHVEGPQPGLSSIILSNSVSLHETVLNSVFSLVASFFQPLVWVSMLTGALAVSVCKDNSFLKKIGCCVAPEGSLRSFSYAHSKPFLFPPPFAVLLEVNILKTEETGACCALFVLIYTWHWCSDSTSVKPLWGLKLFPDKMTVMALHLQWLENALSLTLRSRVTSLSLLAWAFRGQRLFA